MRSSSWPGLDDGDAHAMAGRFRLFGERWFAESSPLYTQLSLAVADDPEIAAMLLAAPVDQRSPTLFFAAVHFLVMRSPDEPLAVHFPDVSSLPPAPDGAYPMLRELCLRRSEELGGLIASRHTQTNEVGRCSFLLPALEVISSAVERRPLALVEVGCSAGLNLLMDRYRIDFGAVGRSGPADSALTVRTEVRGELRPPVPSTWPTIASRLGIEINPIDVRDPDDALWLRACVWPEHHERLRVLTRAVEIARADPPTVLAGDAAALLPGALRESPPDAHPVVIHTQVLPYFSAEARDGWMDVVSGAAGDRDLTLLLCESTVFARTVMRPTLELEALPPDGMVLARIDFAAGSRHEEVLALTSAHGTWLEWLRH